MKILLAFWLLLLVRSDIDKSEASSSTTKITNTPPPAEPPTQTVSGSIGETTAASTRTKKTTTAMPTTTATKTPPPPPTTNEPVPEEGDIRLRNGLNDFQGRVEIFHNNAWGTVCDDKFGAKDAAVVCRQLGISPEGAVVGAPTDRFGPGAGPIWLDELGCLGSESRLVDCPHNNWVTDCSHSEDIGVECRAQVPLTTLPTGSTGPTVAPDLRYGYGNCTDTQNLNVRLVGPGDQPTRGVVQINDGRGWATVCDDSFQMVDAKVVCSQLCYTDTTNSLAGGETFDTSSILEPVSQLVYDCIGDETLLADCPYRTGNCGSTEMAVVSCRSCVECDLQPSRPKPILECEDGNMVMKFKTSENPDLSPSSLNVDRSGDAPCNPLKYFDQGYWVISIPFVECDTQRRVNSTHMTYSNTIRYGPTYPPGAIVISNDHIIHATCEIPRTTVVHKPFVPITDVFNLTEEGEFNAKITYFSDWGFTSPVTEFPLQVISGTYVIAAVELEEQDPDLKLVVPNCFTTPTNNRYHDVNWPLFIDKCKQEPSVRLFSLDDKKFGYCMQAFEFVGYDEVHIHCDAFVCTRGEESDECDRTCFEGEDAAARKKRSGFAHKKFHISSKVVVVYNRLVEEDVVEIVQSPVVVTLQPENMSSEPPETEEQENETTETTTPATETTTPGAETTTPTTKTPEITRQETTEKQTEVFIDEDNEVDIKVDVDIEANMKETSGSNYITFELSMVTVLLTVYRFV